MGRHLVRLGRLGKSDLGLDLHSMLELSYSLRGKCSCGADPADVN